MATSPEITFRNGFIKKNKTKKQHTQLNSAQANYSLRDSVISFLGKSYLLQCEMSKLSLKINFFWG